MADYEKAARIYCSMVGLDANESVCHGQEVKPFSGWQLSHSVAMWSPRWCLVAEALKEMDVRMIALR